MKKKGNRFLNFIFSLLPGAGHMYMGFMKLGISLMSLFFLIIFLSSWLSIGPLLYLLPILWFYSFFDCMNKCYASNEIFESYTDDYLFHLGTNHGFVGSFSNKYPLFAGIAVLLLGIYLIWINVLNILYDHIPNQIYHELINLTSKAPQIILGVIILTVGIKLIRNKKKETESDV